MRSKQKCQLRMWNLIFYKVSLSSNETDSVNIFICNFITNWFILFRILLLRSNWQMKILFPYLETRLEVFNRHFLQLDSHILSGFQMATKELGFDILGPWNSNKDADQENKGLVLPKKIIFKAKILFPGLDFLIRTGIIFLAINSFPENVSTK